jgi:CheY-like chemotaxis protein
MPKLLIIDDDPALRRLLRLELESTYEIVDSGEPEQGLAFALEHKPDAILLDLRMPKYSGYELCQTFTAFSRTQTIPVFIVSGEAGAQTKEYCKQLGAAGYFEKPIDFDALRKCLAEFTKTSRHIPRSEVRVRLRVPLKLRGADKRESKFDETVMTENVSLSGFLCDSTVDLAEGAIVEVYMMGEQEEYAGKAAVVHADGKGTGTAVHRYGCRFTEKAGPWVLK